jgi:NADH:ubiquinone oxidoreductase subunit 5 (subunit L)/multisubunit Na+/H+ antiporter MnhA subunit/multisubunit Na+/H+ antiporter MnhB subunit
LLWIAIIGVPMLLALLLTPLYQISGRNGLITAVVGALSASFVAALSQYAAISADPLNFTWSWVPQLGLELTFYIDGLSLLFVALVTGVGAAIFFFAGHYFDDDNQTLRFYRMLLLFTGSMLWLVMAGNVLAMFIAWELTSITSFLLISFKSKYEDARGGALQALMITGGGGLALVVGLLLMGAAAGSMEFTDILAAPLTDHPWYMAMVILIALGAFTKSAQFPFHFWLPGAMKAPSPASAFLHSATMVKAGIYLLARVYPAIGGTAFWQMLLVSVGLFTFLMGSVLALRNRDLKGILAYTTIAKLGALVALIGLPEYAGFKAAMVGVLAHALYKAPLFLLAGVIDHATGTRIVDKLGNLRERLPAAGVITALAAISMAGVIPFLGFVSKETFLEAFIDDTLALAVIVVGAIFTVAVAGVLIYDVFVRENPDADYSHFHQPSRMLLVSPGLLALTGLVTALVLPQTIIPLIEPAVPKEFSLYLFPGINTAFILSTLAIVLGLVLFATRSAWIAFLQRVPVPSGAAAYDGSVKLVEWSADMLLRTQNGKIRHYLMVILGSVGAIMIVSGMLVDTFSGAGFMLELRDAGQVLEVALLLLALGATLASILFKDHAAAALSLGVMGYAVGGVFLIEPAPDVALVQFVVETLGTVLVIMMIGRVALKRRETAMESLWEMPQWGIWRDILISAFVGLGVGAFALTAVMNRPDRDSISQWHLENAYPETGVVDVVASIIADFRATDTFIEIFVFGMAALGVLTVLTFTRAKTSEPDKHMPEDTTEISNPLTRGVANIVLPLSIIISAVHVLYAGDGPGDGFTAGVISGLGIALWYVVYGYEEAEERLRWLAPRWLIVTGLSVAMINAILPMLAGREFFALTKITGITPPAGLHLASTLFFEIGIFLTVFGAVGVIMEAITHPKEIEQE